MKFAIPTVEGKLCLHFGHCQKFVIVGVESDKIVSVEEITPPPHQPGLLPRWLNEKNVNVVIAGGMGMRAQNLFTQNNIQVITGANSEDPKKLVEDYLSDTLQTGENACSH